MKRPIQYTKKRHYSNVRKMCKFEDSKIESHTMCPLEFDEGTNTITGTTENFENSPCVICRKFIRLRKTRKIIFEAVGKDGNCHVETVGCPCLVLGIDEAMDRTRKALKHYRGKWDEDNL